MKQSKRRVARYVLVSSLAVALGLMLALVYAGSPPELPDVSCGGLTGNYSWSPDSRRVAFTAKRCLVKGSFVGDQTRNIYIATADGTVISRLTDYSSPYWADDPAWSPDGGEIAFSAAGWIVTYSLDGQELSKFTEDGLRCPRWSADGTQLILASIDVAGITSCAGVKGDIIASADGKTTSTLSNSGQSSPPLYEPHPASLVQPAFAQEAAFLDLGDPGVSFLETTAGIAVYTNAGEQIDLSDVSSVFKAIAKETDTFIAGELVTWSGDSVPTYGLVSRDGWLVAYYPRDLLLNVRLTQASRQASQIEWSTNDHLLKQLRSLSGVLGSALGEVKFYDFQHPQANRLTVFTVMVRDWGKQTATLEIPAKTEVYAAQWHIWTQNCSSRFLLDEKAISKGEGSRSGASGVLASGQLKAGKSHSVTVTCDTIMFQNPLAPTSQLAMLTLGVVYRSDPAPQGSGLAIRGNEFVGYNYLERPPFVPALVLGGLSQQGTQFTSYLPWAIPTVLVALLGIAFLVYRSKRREPLLAGQYGETASSLSSLRPSSPIRAQAQASALMCPYCLERGTITATAGEAGRRQYACSSCRTSVVPEYVDHDRVSKVVVSAVGFSGHGKTVYFAALCSTWESLAEVWPNFYTFAVDEKSLATVRENRTALEQGQLPQATPMSFPVPAIVRFSHVPDLGDRFFLFYDTGGEAYERAGAVVQHAKFVARSPAVLFLVSLDDLAYDARRLHDLISVYVQGLTELGGDTRSQHLLVVLTKGDRLEPRLRNRPQVWSYLREGTTDALKGTDMKGYLNGMKEVSAQLRGFFRDEFRAAQFLNFADGRFRSVEFCIVSALGSEPVDGTLPDVVMPKRVLDPLLWMMFKA